jgi:hypothetical protein
MLSDQHADLRHEVRRKTIPSEPPEEADGIRVRAISCGFRESSFGTSCVAVR